MAPLEIKVVGRSSISRRAERGFLQFAVQAEGPSQETVSRDFTTTSNGLRQMLQELAPKTGSDVTDPDAAVTEFTVGSIRSHWLNRQAPSLFGGGQQRPQEKQFRASTTVKATFRDLQKLGEFAGMLVNTPHVQVQRLEWRLTEETQKAILSEVRKMALRDAIQKARDYADVLWREVAAVEVSEPPSYGFGGGAGLFASTNARVANEAQGAETSDDSLVLEPQDVYLDWSLDVKFRAE